MQHCNPNPNDTKNAGNNRKNRNGIGTWKSELVKQEVPTGVTVLRLVLPMTVNNYMDFDNATTEQALESILDILEYQEEGIALVGKQEWMETWKKQDNLCTLLSNIGEIKQDMAKCKISFVLLFTFSVPCWSIQYRQPSKTHKGNNKPSPVAHHDQHELL
jgi:hypothetical protein